MSITFKLILKKGIYMLTELDALQYNVQTDKAYKQIKTTSSLIWQLCWKCSNLFNIQNNCFLLSYFLSISWVIYATEKELISRTEPIFWTQTLYVT